MGLPPKKLRAARLIAVGMTRNDVAGRLSIDISTLRRWHTDDEEFRAEIEDCANRMADQIEAALLEGERKAALVIDEAMEAINPEGDPDWNVRLKAAMSLLDRQGRRGKAVDKVESKTMELTGDVNELLRNALRDPGMRPYLADLGVAGYLPPSEAKVVESIEDAVYEEIEDGESVDTDNDARQDTEGVVRGIETLPKGADTSPDTVETC